MQTAHYLFMMLFTLSSWLVAVHSIVLDLFRGTGLTKEIILVMACAIGWTTVWTTQVITTSQTSSFFEV